MVYMGSKQKYVKYIVPIIQKYIKENNIDTFVDVFCGGANLTDKIDCDVVIGNDLSPSLIALHKQAQMDFDKIPTEGGRDYWDKGYAEWKKMKKQIDDGLPIDTEMPLYKIGAVEWYSSFARGGFPLGYAKPSETRDYYKEGYRNHKKQAETENYKKIIFVQGDYRDLTSRVPLSHTLFYCDSPYLGTRGYGINKKFNHDEYYDWLRETGKQVPIFVSEQFLPNDFNIVWEKDVVRTVNLQNNYKACEKLYFIDNRKVI